MSLPLISIFLPFLVAPRPKAPFSHLLEFVLGQDGEKVASQKKSFVVWETWAFVVSFPLPATPPTT